MTLKISKIHKKLIHYILPPLKSHNTQFSIRRAWFKSYFRCARYANHPVRIHHEQTTRSLWKREEQQTWIFFSFFLILRNKTKRIDFTRKRILIIRRVPYWLKMGSGDGETSNKLDFIRKCNTEDFPGFIYIHFYSICSPAGNKPIAFRKHSIQ